MEAGLVCLGKNAGGWTNHACEKGEQWQQILDLFEKLPLDHLQCCHQHLREKREMAAGLVSLGKHACGWVNNACEKGEQWKHVLDLSEKMRGESVQRDAITYIAASSACLNASNGCRQWLQALDTSSWPDVAK